MTPRDLVGDSTSHRGQWHLVIVERQRGLPSPVGLSVIRVDRDDVVTWAWRSKASSLKLHGRRRGSPRSARFCSSREHDDRGASHSFPAFSSGRPVWLPLARREEITVVRTSPDLRSGAGSGRSPGVVVVGPIRRRPPSSRLPSRRACGARGPAARPHARTPLDDQFQGDGAARRAAVDGGGCPRSAC